MSTNETTTNAEDGCVSSAMCFPMRLHKFLQEAQDTNNSHVASFQPHGNCFRIYDPDAFLLLSSRWGTGISCVWIMTQILTLYLTPSIIYGSGDGFHIESMNRLNVNWTYMTSSVSKVALIRTATFTTTSFVDRNIELSESIESP